MTRSIPFVEGRRTLAIDTSTGNCSVALFAGRALIDYRDADIGRGHAERLLPMIAELQNGGHADHILVGCGPGSFTGLRVGIAAARALALGWEAAVSGYSSLALLAAQAFAEAPDSEAMDVVQHGGHGEYFVETFIRAPFAAQAPVVSISPEAAAIRTFSEAVTGSAAAELVKSRGFGRAVFVTLSTRGLDQLAAIHLDLPPTPLYVRGADAQPQSSAQPR